MRPLIFYHGGGCRDGFCSAWVANRYFKGEADFIPVSYGQPPPDVKKRIVYILDFSYKRDVLLNMARESFLIKVLDHHETAAKELSGGCRIADSGTCLLADKLMVNFDMGKSGARLTWEQFYPNEKSPWLVDYTETRDLWKWDLPFSHEVNACLRTYPMEFALWDQWADSGWNDPPSDFITEGKAILRRENQLVDDHVKYAREISLDGIPVLVVNATCMMSEIGNELAKKSPSKIGATWFRRSDGKYVWSLRSTEDGPHVGELAKKFGGGGHPRAGGFESPISLEG